MGEMVELSERMKHAAELIKHSTDIVLTIPKDIALRKEKQEAIEWLENDKANKVEMTNDLDKCSIIIHILPSEEYCPDVEERLLQMTLRNGEEITWSDENKRWEYPDGKPYVDDGEICNNCGKPSIDINGVEDCDFCMQSLTVCDFIDYACCGHGNDELAYIHLKDGRRFVLDKMNW